MPIISGDYIGFQLNGVHSSELGIVRVSDGSRYKMTLLPELNNITSDVNGMDGIYYFDSNFKQKEFSLSIAYDALTEEQLSKLINLLSTKTLMDLIFDELPYKVWKVKISSPPSIETIPFSEGVTGRVYKGEGTINLVSYSPYALSRYKFLNLYSNDNINEWKTASKMKESQGVYDGIESQGVRLNLYNAGDVDAYFKAYYPITSEAHNLTSIKLYKNNILENQINFSGIDIQGQDTYLCINSKTNLITGSINNDGKFIDTGTLYNKYITSGDFFNLPLGESQIESTGIYCQKIEYDYLYY